MLRHPAQILQGLHGRALKSRSEENLLWAVLFPLDAFPGPATLALWGCLGVGCVRAGVSSWEPEGRWSGINGMDVC